MGNKSDTVNIKCEARPVVPRRRGGPPPDFPTLITPPPLKYSLLFPKPNITNTLSIALIFPAVGGGGGIGLLVKIPNAVLKISTIQQ